VTCDISTMRDRVLAAKNLKTHYLLYLFFHKCDKVYANINNFVVLPGRRVGAWEQFSTLTRVRIDINFDS